MRLPIAYALRSAIPLKLITLRLYRRLVVLSIPFCPNIDIYFQAVDYPKNDFKLTFLTNVFIIVFIIVKAMKIFNAFLIIVIASILFMLPFTTAIHDFRTDTRTDTFAGTATGGAQTTANLSLTDFVFDDDTETIVILSDDGTDVPLLFSYNTTTRLTDMTGLAVSSNRTITISYDIDALSESEA
ncbi:hypothetical protein LCGC14_3084560, partial [marine sediment metagenome]